jgi:hypothetical protein
VLVFQQGGKGIHSSGKKRSLAGTAIDGKPSSTKEEYNGWMENGQDKILQNNSTAKNRRIFMIVFNIQKFQRKDQTTMKVIKQMHKRNDDNRFGKFHKKLRVGKSSHN